MDVAEAAEVAREQTTASAITTAQRVRDRLDNDDE
jgi:hypothetical protein